MSGIASGDWPEPMLALMTPAELPAVDGYMAETGTSGFVLMERAGEAIARAAAALAPDARRVVVAAGPTNNGGDSILAARIMREAGRDVTLALLTPPEELKGDPARSLAAWQAPVVRLTPEVICTADLVVDGIYGGGLKHDVVDGAAAAVEAINAVGAPVLAVDFPTGISGGSGAILGTAVNADMTITFFCLKPGHLLFPGRNHCGRVVVDLIGIPASVMDRVSPRTFENRPALWRSVVGTREQPVTAAPASTPPGRTRVQVVPADGKGETFDGGRPHADASHEPAVLVADERSLRQIAVGVSGSKVDLVRAAANTQVVAMLGDDVVVGAPNGRVAITGNQMFKAALKSDLEEVAAAIRRLGDAGMPVFEAAAAACWAFGREGSSADRIFARVVEQRVQRDGRSG